MRGDPKPDLAEARSSDDGSCDWLCHLSEELDRSRRYQRPFDLVRVPLGGTLLEAPEQLCRRLRKRIRSSDRCEWAEGSIYLLLPESTREMGEGLLARLRVECPELRVDEAQLACFPEDGLTGSSLLDAVDRRHPAGPHVGRHGTTEPGMERERVLRVRPLAPPELRRARDALGGG